MSKLNTPKTRYYGSKRKLNELIWREILKFDVDFTSVLDTFGDQLHFPTMLS